MLSFTATRLLTIARAAPAPLPAWRNGTPKAGSKKGDVFIHESIIGSTFTGTIEEELDMHGKPAIRPGIEGWARIYGYNTITIDPEDDPYAYGFQVI